MDRLLRIAIKAAIEAGNEIIKIYASDFAHELKADNSPLTIADKNSNKVINTYLRQTAIPIISEENNQIPYDERKHWKECWVVDPLDGTKEFIKKNGEFTVNIALVKEQQPVLGVVYVPAQKVLYYAIVDSQKAYKIQLQDTNTSVDTILQDANVIKRIQHNSSKLKIVASRSHLNEATEKFINSLQTDKEIIIVSKGSSLKFCLVAEGEADIYPRFAPTMEWDSAAPHAICNAVGVKVVSLETEKELVYNKEDLLNPWFICQ